MERSRGTEAVIERLDSARRRYEAARRELQDVTRERDAQIVRASDLGLSRRYVAQVAGVTGGRVQQILDSRERRAIDGRRPARTP